MSKDKRILESHQKLHKVVKCSKCSKYIKSGSFSTHKRLCSTTPEKLVCGVCEYESVRMSDMRAHRKNHILRPFLCRIGDCRRTFKSAEDLQSHFKLKHGGGFKCEHCELFFKHKYHKNRHIQRIHLYAKQRCSMGWFRPAGVVAKKRAKGARMVPCNVDGCDFKARAWQKDRMERHVAAKHSPVPRPEKP